MSLVGAVMGQQADLTLKKIASVPSVVAGESFTYDLTVKNLGPDTSSASSISDPLTTQVNFVSADPACSYDGGLHEVTCAVPALGIGASAAFSLTVIADNIPPQPIGGHSVAYVSGTDAAAGELFSLDPGGPVDTVTGTGSFVSLQGVARENEAELIVADEGVFDPVDEFDQAVLDGVIARVDRLTGAITPLSSGGYLVSPDGVQLCGGNIFVADRFGIRYDGLGNVDLGDLTGRVLAIDPANGDQSIVAEHGSLSEPAGIDCDGFGQLLVVDATAASLLRVDPSTGTQTVVSVGDLLTSPRAVALESADSALVADAVNGIVRIDLASGTQSQAVAQAPPHLLDPQDLEIDRDGTIWVADAVAGGGSVGIFDPTTGVNLSSILTMPFPVPQGLEIIETVLNRATVVGTEMDPDPSNDDDLAITEIEYPPAVVVVEVNETVTVTDTPEVVLAVMVTLTETVTVTDMPSLLPSVVVALTEIVTVTDTPSAVSAVIVAVNESVTVTDTPNALLAVIVAVNETVTVTDTPNAVSAVMVSVHETVTVTDMSNAITVVVVTVNEAILVSDQRLVTVSDTDGPPRVIWVGTVAQQPDGGLLEGDRTKTSVTQVYVRFSEPVEDPSGDLGPDDVTNPDNYLVVERGADGIFDTVDCATGWHPSDDRITVDSVLYPAVADTAALALDSGLQLLAGGYKLFVCGTTSIVDLDGNKLDGDGDGTGGDDFTLGFEVEVSNPLANPNFDLGLAGWILGQPAGTLVEADSADAGDAPTSGSARMSNVAVGAVMSLSQCVPAAAGKWYGARARVGLDSADPGWPDAKIRLRWFAAADCAGAPEVVDAELMARGSTAGLWQSYEGFFLSPAGVVSVEIGFEASAAEGDDFTASWDDLSVYRDVTVVFVDGFESGDTSAWSAVVGN